MVFYAKDHIEYWPSFFYKEYKRDKYHLLIFTINKILQDISKRGIITVYINFIICYTQEFVQDLDFFQQQNKPIFSFVKERLEQLTSYIEGNLIIQDFEPDIHSLII